MRSLNSPGSSRTSRQWRPMRPPRGLVCISCHPSRRLRESMPARATAATVLPHADTGTSRGRWCCEHAVIDCSLRGMASLLASISKAAGGAARIAAGMRCWHATVGAGCGLGHGAAGSHCGTGTSALEPATAVGAATANDALEPKLTRSCDRLQATRAPLRRLNDRQC